MALSRKVLIIEDEPGIRELMRLAVEEAGNYQVLEAGDGEYGLNLARSRQPDLVLLDLMLPGMDGLSVCRELKNGTDTCHIPIIIVTARSEESDVVVGLEMGASDYITKPFSRKILQARVRAQLREAVEKAAQTELRRGGCVLNDQLHRVTIDGETVELTYSEYEILKLFLSHPMRIYTRGQIILDIRGTGYPVTERAIDVQIVNLRRKLGTWGAQNIETIRGIGYRLKPEW